MNKYKNTEIGRIPNDWEALKLADISVSINSGKSKTKSEFGSKYPIYGSTGIIGFSLKPDYKGEKILVARVGANAGTINIVDNEYCVSDNTLMIQLNSKIDFKFIYFFLKHSNLNKLIFGSGQPLITGTQLKNLTIPLPPTRAEQTAIATALNDADSLIQKLELLLTKKKNIKTAALQQLLKPNENWETKKFDEVFIKINGKVFQLQTKEYLQSGNFPIIDQGQEKIVGYTDNLHKLFKCPKNGIIVFGDHTRILKFIDFDFAIGADGTQLLEVKEKYSTKFLFYFLLKNEVPNTGYNRHFKFLLEMGYNIPNLAQQTRIAQILSDMDAEIEALEKKIAKYKNLKQGMMQELLTGKVRLVQNYKL